MHGACDYLVKPARMEQLRNIWTHVSLILMCSNKYFVSVNAGAVPKKILELMNVDGLSRHNVASHLQVLFPLLYWFYFWVQCTVLLFIRITLLSTNLPSGSIFMFMSMNLCARHLYVPHTKVVVAYTHILSLRLTHTFLALLLQNIFSCFMSLSIYFC